MKNAHHSGQKWNMAHPMDMCQAWLGVVKGVPRLQEVDAIAPAFEICAAFESPVIARRNFCGGDPESEVVGPHQERRKTGSATGWGRQRALPTHG